MSSVSGNDPVTPVTLKNWFDVFPLYPIEMMFSSTSLVMSSPKRGKTDRRINVNEGLTDRNGVKNLGFWVWFESSEN